jgi:hypothetical protein
MKATLAVIVALVLCGGCRGKTDNSSATRPSQPSVTPARLDLSNMSDEKLLSYVGQRVTVVGFWYDLTKSGSCVCATSDGGGSLVTMETSSAQGISISNQLSRRASESVEVTGVLHHRQPPPYTRPSDPRVPESQPSDVRFYFDLEKADIKFVNDAKGATSQPAQ